MPKIAQVCFNLCVGEDGLAGNADALRYDALDAALGRQGDMLEAQVGGFAFGPRRLVLHEIQHAFDSPVAHRVQRKLATVRFAEFDRRARLLVAADRQAASGVVSTRRAVGLQVGFVHPRGLAGDAPIADELEPADEDLARTVHELGRDVEVLFVHPVIPHVVDAHFLAQAKLCCALDDGEVIGVVERAHVRHRDNALGGEQVSELAQFAGGLFGAGFRHDARYEVARVLAQNAGGLAVLVALDDAAVRIGRVARDACELERTAVHAAHVGA